MAFDDIIPLDALLGKQRDPQYEDNTGGNKKKKKVDREAMQSAIMRIPRMDVRVARDLIDIGIKEIYELQGRSAESLMDEIKQVRPETPDYRLAYLRMGIYWLTLRPASNSVTAVYPQCLRLSGKNGALIPSYGGTPPPSSRSSNSKDATRAIRQPMFLVR